MICYKDRTFCSSDCSNRGCVRHWDEGKASDAKAWWGGEDAPVAFADMSAGCLDYKPPREVQP